MTSLPASVQQQVWVLPLHQAATALQPQDRLAASTMEAQNNRPLGLYIPHLPSGCGWSFPRGGSWQETLPSVPIRLSQFVWACRVRPASSPHHQSQLTTRRWLVDSSTPLFHPGAQNMRPQITWHNHKVDRQTAAQGVLVPSALNRHLYTFIRCQLWTICEEHRVHLHWDQRGHSSQSRSSTFHCCCQREQ